MKLTSPVFEENASIPKEFTCDGADDSPPLHISDVPQNAKSLALIVDDPDAPQGTLTHWILFNLPPSETYLEKNIHHAQALPDGTRQGVNDFQRTGYTGPCPPSGIHHYLFQVYALDTELNIPEREVTKSRLLHEMKGHILDGAELVGTYRHPEKNGAAPEKEKKERLDRKVQQASEESFPASDPPATW